MTIADVDAVMAVVDAANAAQAQQGSQPARTQPSPEELAGIRRGHARFVAQDSDGAWVAESGGRVVGVAESIRRADFWGLSMLFVDPGFQSRGVGRQLLDAALGYAAGARVRMIQSSSDPRAMRRYALAGLTMHPMAGLGGTPERRAIPAGLPGRPGDLDDLDLVDDVEARLGRRRTVDVVAGLEDQGCRLEVVDESRDRRGWAIWRPGRLYMLGATDEHTAAALLWRYLGEAEGDVLASGLTSRQNWAFSVAHSARLTVRVGGAMFVDGMDIPGPWIPSGWYM